MKAKIARLAVILAGVLFQTSALAVLFPYGQAPNIILLIVISWTIIAGFDKIWPWAIVAGVVLDLASFEPVGKNVIFLLIISYTVNFFLQRFLTENRLWKTAMISFFVVAAAVSYAFYDIFFLLNSNGIGLREKVSLAAGSIIVQTAGSAVLFCVCHALLKRLENFLSLHAFQAKINK